MNLLLKAQRLAMEAFEGKLDKGGVPYIQHCFHVMCQVSHLEEDVWIVAVLHDLFEDTDWDFEKLVQYGFPFYIAARIEKLTKKKYESYREYIERVANDPVTKAIKIADLSHNMNLTRLPYVTSQSIQRNKKYSAAYHYLLDGFWKEQLYNDARVDLEKKFISVEITL